MSQPRVYNITMPDHMLSLNELHEMAINFAEEHFGRKGAIPFLWIMDLGHEILWIETPWEDDAEKEACIKIMQIILREAKARAYASMIEAWTSKAKPGDEKIIMPSARPQSERDDIMMVTSFNKSGEQIMSRYLVTVRRRGLNFLGPRDDMDFTRDNFAGRMFNLIKNTATCQGCGLTIGHRKDCKAPLIAKIFTDGKV